MRSNIRRRLDRLADQMPPPKRELSQAQFFLMKCIAYYFGKPTPDEPSFVSAFARALGYACERDMDRDLQHKSLTFLQHLHFTYRKLSVKFDTSSFRELPIVAERMYADMADWYKQRECPDWPEILQSINEEFACFGALNKRAPKTSHLNGAEIRRTRMLM